MCPSRSADDDSQLRGTPLTASLTLRDVYGGGVYCPRASPNAARWLSEDPVLLNSRTGAMLTVAGGMPVMCCRGAALRDGLDLLRAAGFPPPPKLHRFGSEEEYLATLAALVRSGERLVIRHAHRPDEVPPKNSWIPREVLVFLNNKANLALLMGAEEAPRRKVAPIATLSRSLNDVELPVVIKAATDDSAAGGGLDVRICRVREDLPRALADFGGCTNVVLEEFLEMTRNLCLNYAIMPDGAVRYLGSAEQVCDEQGLYLGNWIDDAAKAPGLAIALGERVGMRAAARGYRGFFGIDMALRADGPVLAFDLNFRTNGSTGALLLYESVCRHMARATMRLRGWTSKRSYGEVLRAAYSALEAGYFIPLASHDPLADGFISGPPRLLGLLVGRSRDEVREREAEFAALGVE